MLLVKMIKSHMFPEGRRRAHYDLRKKENLTRNPRLLGNLTEWCSFFLQLPKILNIITAADQKQENEMDAANLEYQR